MRTIPLLFEKSVSQYKNNALIFEKKKGVYKSLSYAEVHKLVNQAVLGFKKLGIQKGDRVAMLSEGRSEWIVSELALFYIGAINVPLSIKLLESTEVRFRIEHSECSFIITSGRQKQKVEAIAEKEEIKALICFDLDSNFSSKTHYFETVLSTGEEENKLNKTTLQESANEIGESLIANICYTSGTTADPKGIMLTHRNYTANIEQANSIFQVPESYNSLLILPWDHSFAHTVGLYTLIKNGASMSCVDIGNSALDTLKNIPINIKETKPTFLLSVPALAKNFKKNIEKGVSSKGKITEILFTIALANAYKYNGLGYDKGKSWRIILGPINIFFDKIIFSKVRENFGGKLKFFVGGGALLDIDLQRFFYALGIPMFQGYGLTEASPIISSNSPTVHKLGSSGKIVSNLELKIIDESGNECSQGKSGEIVIKGENVMAGYWNNEKASSESLLNGWLYTGDIGYLDNDGFLYVLGRFKSLLIGNDGEKFSPEGIEEAIVEQSQLIDQCMLYNNQNAYTVGLLVINQAAVNAIARKSGIDPLNDELKRIIIARVSSEISQFLPGGDYENIFPSRWLPSSYILLNEAFTEDNKLMNSTMKIVRDKIIAKYKQEIDFLYTPKGKDPNNSMNTDTLEKIILKK